MTQPDVPTAPGCPRRPGRGANRGIGRELAAQLAADGDTVQLDTSEPASIEAAAREIEARHGHLDVLVNNVGGIFDYAQQASTADLGVVQDALEINLFSAWRVTPAMLPLLRTAQSGARIVTVSSEAASLERMGAGTPAYGASKAALNALTRSLAAELADDGITVHAGSPGWSATDLGGEGGRPVAEGAASVKNVVNLARRHRRLLPGRPAPALVTATRRVRTC